MIRRMIALVWALSAPAALGQVPQGQRPGPTAEVAPERGDPAVRLPQAESRVVIDGGRVAVVRGAGLSWQLVNGSRLFRDFGQDLTTADDTCRAMRDLQATEWVTIGAPTPVLEYGLTSGRAATGVPRASQSVALDATTRVERLRGVWLLRTETAVVANFGGDRLAAEQSIAAIKRYGFNRAGQVGRGRGASFLYYGKAEQDAPARASGLQALAVASIGESLTRTGVNVPGTDEYVGERTVIDPRAVELARDGSRYSLRHGAETLASFGGDEWAARDALTAVREGRFTDVCKVGGATFFLTHGRPPSHVGLGTRATRFDAKDLAVRPAGQGFALVDPRGVRVLTASTRADAEALLRVVAGYGFDALCECGGGRRGGLSYLAKTGR